jgi:hypothetical protein
MISPLLLGTLDLIHELPLGVEYQELLLHIIRKAVLYDYYRSHAYINDVLEDGLDCVHLIRVLIRPRTILKSDEHLLLLISDVPHILGAWD